MDNDYSSSSDESSDDSYSSEESARLEDCRINGTAIQLPAGLCENKDIFDEFFSYRNLQECFTEQQKRDLLAFLPTFPENDRKEKEETLRKLFSGENMRFGAPLPDFHSRLKNGYYRPDISKMRSVLRRSRARDNRQRLKIYYSKLVKEILVSRQRLLERSYALPPGATAKMERPPPAPPSRPPLAEQRTKRRYFEELSAIRKEIGESDHSSQDDNYPEGPPWRASKKQRRQLAALESALGPRLVAVTSTLSARPTGLDLANRVAPAYNPFDTGEDAHRAALAKHARRRRKNKDHPELWIQGLTMDSVASRTLGRKGGPIKDVPPTRLKKKSRPQPPPATPPAMAVPEGRGASSASDVDSCDEERSTSNHQEPVSVAEPVLEPVPDPVPAPALALVSAKPAPRKRAGSVPKPVRRESPKKIKIEPMDVEEAVEEVPPLGPAPVENRPRHQPATVLDLAGFDMMSLPIDLEDNVVETTTSEADSKPALELMQATHCCFFALLRDIICSTPEHRMDLSTIEERLRGWQQNPISPLNHWHSLASDWLQQLPSAVMFLCGEYAEGARDDFVPYLEFKPQAQAYQWIGAGRDSDSHLQPLCAHWLHNRDQMASRPITMETEMEGEEEDDTDDRTASPPPPRCPTAWAVRATSAEEKRAFRAQEARRYASPHRAFTFRMHGYESVVGPVKGIYNPAAGGGLKPARGHSLLVAERPGFVTILCLARDAAARLPNGEGTRTDICELLKDSQYLASVSLESYLHSVVSGALDRLHYETDPCVKYDTKRKIWIYLHRGRTEDEFERMHQQFQGVAKTKKTSGARKPNRPRKEPRVTATATRDPEPLPVQESAEKQVTPALREPTPPPLAAPVAAPSTPVARVAKVVPPPATPTTQAANTQTTLLSGGSLVSPAASSAPAIKTVTLTPQQLQSARTAARQPGAKLSTPLRLTQSPRTQSVVASPSAQVVKTPSPARAQTPSSGGQQMRIQQVNAGSVQPVRSQQSSPATSQPIRVQQTATGPVQQIRIQQTAAGNVHQIKVQQTGGAIVQSIRMQPNAATTAQRVQLAGAGASPIRTGPGSVQPIKVQQTTGGVQQIKVQQTGAASVQPVRMHQSAAGTAQPARAQQSAGASPIRMQQASAVVQQIRAQQGGVQPIRIQHAGASGVQQIRTQGAGAGAVQHIRVQQTVAGTVQPIRIQQSAGSVQPARVQQAGAGTVQSIRIQQSGAGTVQPIRIQQTAAGGAQPIRTAQSGVRIQAPAAGTQQTRPVQFVTSPAAMKTAIRVANPAAAAALLKSRQQKQLILQRQTELATSLANQQQQALSSRHKAKVTALAQMQQLRAGVGKVQLPTQVLSVESLLAHQKQGTALRVSSTAGAGTSLIQIPSSTPGGQPQYAVVSQGSLVSVGQPRALQQQMSGAGKLKAGGTNLRMVATTSAGARAGNLRVANPTGLNLATVAGKPVLLASKAQVGGQQNVYLTTQAGAGGQQTVVLSQALRGQGGHLVLQQGGNPQILLPPGFQAGTINLKTLQGLQGLQGLKVIPMQQGGKGRQPVYARIINPNARPTTLLQPQLSVSAATEISAPTTSTAPATVTVETPAPAPAPAKEQPE